MTSKPPTPYKLSKTSEKNLLGVHPDLVRVATRAIGISHVDFRVLEGLRTAERQMELFKKGASKLDGRPREHGGRGVSRHQTGHAIDLVPMVGRQLRWDWPLFYPIAQAMKIAAEAEGVLVRWGGCWTTLNAIDDPEDAVEDYVTHKRLQGRKAFIDGPHFELPESVYP